MSGLRPTLTDERTYADFAEQTGYSVPELEVTPLDYLRELYPAKLTARQLRSAHVANVIRIEDVYPMCGHFERFIVHMHHGVNIYDGVQCRNEFHLPIEARQSTPYHERISPLAFTTPIYKVRIGLQVLGDYSPEFKIVWEEVK